jgi:hypothetical protein
LSSTAQPTVDGNCDTLWSGFSNGHLYGIVNVGLLRFAAASLYVRRLGPCCGKQAHLASITSQAENEYLEGRFASIGNVLLGLNNMGHSAGYRWDGTNETVPYVNWCDASSSPPCTSPAYPSQGPGASCAGMINNGGLWRDYDCNSATFVYLLIEYDCDPASP